MSDTDPIYPGSIVRITNGDGFKAKPSGDLFDPEVLTLTVKPPTGDVVDLSDDVHPTAEDSVGTFYADWEAGDYEGLVWFHWDGDDVVNEGHFIIARRHVPAVPA